MSQLPIPNSPSVSDELPSNGETPVINDQSSINATGAPLPPHTQGYVNPFTGIPQNVSQLPKLTLPIFEGDPLQWQTFWDSFESAVHANHLLTDVQKLNYLRAHLKGEAVAGFLFTSVNYGQPLDVLKYRFGDQQRIINAHMHALMNLPSASNNISSLRALHDVIESHVRGLSALGQSPGPLLVPVILGKLPPDVRKSLAREHSNLQRSLDQLREAIVTEIKVLEAGAFAPSSTLESQHSPSATASFLTSSTSRPDKKPKCPFCKGPHTAIQCDVVPDQAKRMEIVKQDRLCFNCLGHHKASQCQSKGHCKHCKELHHTSLCWGTRKPQSPTIDSSTPTPPSTNPDEPSTQTGQHLVNTTFSYPQPAKVCFLKTAVATVRANNYSTRVNILLDEGA